MCLSTSRQFMPMPTHVILVQMGALGPALATLISPVPHPASVARMVAPPTSALRRRRSTRNAAAAATSDPVASNPVHVHVDDGDVNGSESSNFLAYHFLHPALFDRALVRSNTAAVGHDQNVACHSLWHAEPVSLGLHMVTGCGLWGAGPCACHGSVHHS